MKKNSIKKAKKQISVKGRKKKEFNLKSQYRMAYLYLKESDNYIAMVIGIFAFLFMIGFVYFYIAPKDGIEPVLVIIQSWVNSILEKTEGLGFIGLWKFIFLNNSIIASISVFSGFFLSFLPALLLISNSLFLGLVSGLVYSFTGISTFWKLLPHGIFELPAIFISIALGIRFGTFIFYKDPLKIFIYFFTNSVRVFLLIILPLLIIASFIEAGLIILFG